MISMMVLATRTKPTLRVPPWASVQVAKTEAEKEKVTNQHVSFVKGASVGVCTSHAEKALLDLWSSTTVNDLVTKKDQFPRIEGTSTLSLESLRKLVEAIAEPTDNGFTCGGTYYVVFPTSLADVVRGVRNQLRAKEKRHASEVETDGAVYRTEAYWTYALDVETQGQCHEATVAFCEVRGETSLGNREWLVIQHDVDDPALTHWVDPDRPPYVSPTTALENTCDVEYRAVAAIRGGVEKNGLTIEHEAHEPNGHGEFPDFQLVISGQDWTVEVTRVLGDIVGKRIVTIGVKDTEAHVSRAAKAPALSHEDIHKAVEKALSDKAAMVPKLAPNTRYCVVLVDTLEQLEPSDDNYWSGFDLSAFDAVAVARIEENSPTALGFVKGNIG